MKKMVLFTIIAVAMIAVFAGCTVKSDGDGSGVVTLEQNETETKIITVSAQGTMTVMPDVAYVTVGVTTQNKDMQKAQDNNAEAMSAMFEALKSAGLTDDDMRTTQYNAYPLYDYSSNRQTITGYEVTNQVELTIRDIDRVGEYIDIAVNNGANMTNSISFGILDQQSCYNEALKLAMETAKAKADTLAAAGGVKIIGTLQIMENSSGGQVYRAYAEAALDDTASSATPISTGDLEVQASVTVVYEIE